MGSMVRSAKLTFCVMYLQREAAYQILCLLGEEGCIQFEDMTPNLPPNHRQFTNEMCRCLELERILLYMIDEIKKENLPRFPAENDPPALKMDELNELEAQLEKWGRNIKEIGEYQTKLLENEARLYEMLYVLKNIEPVLERAEIRSDNNLMKIAGGGGDLFLDGQLHVFIGALRRDKAFALETMLWRISRGNIFFRPAQSDGLLLNPATGTTIRKVAFVAICQGQQLKGMVEKVCAAFHANMYECPETYELRQVEIAQIAGRIFDVSEVIRKSKHYRCKQLLQVTRGLNTWLIRVKKAKAVYYCMNLFNVDISRKCLIGQCWIPTDNLSMIQGILENETAKARSSGSAVKSFVSKLQTEVTPPTFNRTNKFTKGFQVLISAYGDAIYGELNPGLYTIITFPFLFAIMFGDAGHGCIMLAFALWMVCKEKKFLRQESGNEIWNILFAGRYVILLMSLFTLYTGFIYNDWFSKPLKLKSNYWINTFPYEILIKENSLQLDPANKTGSWYTLGMDPGWGSSINKIMNENSLKMKLSIIIGVIHMMFGVWLSLFNHIFFRKYYAIVFEFIPQVLILTSLFVWLCVMVIMKWFKYGPKRKTIQFQPTCAPSILILFIDMCLLRSTKVEPGSQCEAYMFSGQEILQKSLVFVALASIPVLLLGSPIYIALTNKKKKKIIRQKIYEYLETRRQSSLYLNQRVDRHLYDKLLHYSETFSELLIHQSVHTIEYVLSTISHTASYLRLWALSLAHAQLSEMLWGMILSKLALQDHSWIGAVKLFFIFAIWAFFSFAILIVMEGLSAFLHTLRLHWVEFMSKFFIGGGEKFCPFSFKELLQGDRKEGTEIEGSCKKGSKKLSLSAKRWTSSNS